MSDFLETGSANVVVEETLMRRETAEAPAVVARLLDTNRAILADVAAELRASPPAVVITGARGSSDHAATYGKYLIETYVGVPVASAAPSVVSRYGASVQADRALCLAISQSGRSPDLLAVVSAYRAAGAQLLAMVNDETSPLAAACDRLIPLCAGLEQSVAATKSCIAAMVAQAALVAAWSKDRALAYALAGLPQALERALAVDWSVAIEPLSTARQMFVIGRGYSLGIAQEAALKLKETCAIQAEPFSAAEVRHGPMAIVGSGFPIIAFATSDGAGEDVLAVAETFRKRDAAVFLLHAGGGPPLEAETGHPALEPIMMLASFYCLAEALARARGFDPDTPPHLAKVTETL